MPRQRRAGWLALALVLHSAAFFSPQPAHTRSPVGRAHGLCAGGHDSPGPGALASSTGESMEDLLAFARALPKAELHAHLHGSIRPATLAALARERGLPQPPALTRLISLDAAHDAATAAAAVGGGGSGAVPAVPLLREVFEIFDVIHDVVRDVGTVQRIAREALADCAADGVAYVELRTTPRPLADGTSREGYIAAVLQVLEECDAEARVLSELRAPLPPLSPQRPWLTGTVPRLLLSVDRGGTVEAAWEVVELALSLSRRSRYVVGVDLSGNPNKGRFADFAPALSHARSHGLKVTAHCAEVPDAHDTSAILDFAPERLGHALHLTPAAARRVAAARTPVEVCPTSNLVTLGLNGHREHPTAARWLSRGHPMAVATDDAGVFATALSRELAAVAAAFALPRASLAALARSAFDLAFDASGAARELGAAAEARCEALVAAAGDAGGL